MRRVARARAAGAALTLLAAAVPRVSAQPVRGAVASHGTTALTLDEAVAVALRQSYEVRAAAAARDSARAERRIAGALPNPTLAGIPNAPYQYSAALPIDVGPQRSYRTRVSAIGATAAAQDARDVDRQVTLVVRRTFLDVLLADALWRLAADRYDLVLQLHAGDSARVRAGDIPGRNLVRGAVELARAEADRVRAGVAIANARLALQGAMGVARPDTALPVVGSLEYQSHAVPALDSLVTIARARRPDAAAARAREAQGRVAQRLAAASLVPIPELTYVRQFTGSFDNGHAYAFGLGFEFPVLNRYRGQRERAAAAASAARSASERADAQVEREVTAAAAALLAQTRLVARYEGGLLRFVDQNVDAARYAYAHGATSLLEVLDALRAQQDVRTDYLTALHDYWAAVYALDAAVGDSPMGDAR